MNSVSEIYDRNGIRVEPGCDLKSVFKLSTITLRCIGILDQWVLVSQKFKGAHPWVISAADFPQTQYIVTKKPNEEP